MRILIGHTNQIAEVKEGRPLPGRAGLHDEILALGEGYAHLNVTPAMSWQDILAQCPPDWQMDVYIHWSPEYNPVPEGLESADCLTVGVFGDWNLGGRAMQTIGGLFDVVVADKVGCERLRDMGYKNIIHSLLWAFDPHKHRRLHDSKKNNAEKQARPIDILMIGNFNHAIQWERAPWLARVAHLSQNYRVVLTSGLFGDAYIQAMNQAKIVFNRSIRGEANMRAYEAPACGALMFYEAENCEIRDIYTDREHCVLYDDTNLESLLAYYLDPKNADEREQVAQRGWERVQQHSYAHHFADLLNRLEPLLHNRTRRIDGFTSAVERKKAYAMQWLMTCKSDWYFKTNALLIGAFSDDKSDAASHDVTSEISNLNAVLWGEIARCAAQPGFQKQSFQTALGYAEQSVRQSPDFAIARFNLAALKLADGSHAEAEILLGELAESLIIQSEDRLKIHSEYSLNVQTNVQKSLEEAVQAANPGNNSWQILAPTFPRQFSWFDVAMEWAYGQYAPQSSELKRIVRSLLMCRVQLMLVEMTYGRGQYAASVRHAMAAVEALPTLGEAHYALSCSLRALGRTEEAVTAYHETITLTPFNMAAHEELIRLYLDMERATDALDHANQWLSLLNGCPGYVNHLPTAEHLKRTAQSQKAKEALQAAAHVSSATHANHLSASNAKGSNASTTGNNSVPMRRPDHVQRFLALPDWNRPEQWQAIISAFARTYKPSDMALLLLRVDPAVYPDARGLLMRLEHYLRADLKCSANDIPNLTLVTDPLGPTDCWKLTSIADAVLMSKPEELPIFWRDLAQARCIPVLACSELSDYAETSFL